MKDHADAWSFFDADLKKISAVDCQIFQTKADGAGEGFCQALLRPLRLCLRNVLICCP